VGQRVLVSRVLGLTGIVVVIWRRMCPCRAAAGDQFAGQGLLGIGTSIFPVIAAVVVAVRTLLSLPADFRAYAGPRQSKTQQQRASARSTADGGRARHRALASDARALADPGSPLTGHADPTFATWIHLD